MDKRFFVLDAEKAELYENQGFEGLLCVALCKIIHFLKKMIFNENLWFLKKQIDLRLSKNYPKYPLKQRKDILFSNLRF